MQLQKATRKKVKIKIGINGPSGSGKTMGALYIAYGLCGDWGKIGVIDTENSSASLYEHIGDFLTLDLSAPFSPERYIEAIHTCEEAGMEVIIIDSGTQEWSGIGGYNDLTDKLAASTYKGNNWAARSATMPRHRKFIDYILQSRCHIIVCDRSKVETVMDDNKKVKKIGMKEVQDPELEYEMSIVFSIDRDTHTAIASKDRTELFEGKDAFVITPKTGQTIKEWCEKGLELKKEAAPVNTQAQAQPSKQILSESAFTKAVQRMTTGGETDLLKKIMDTYELDSTQKKVLRGLKLLTKDNKIAKINPNVNKAEEAVPEEDTEGLQLTHENNYGTGRTRRNSNWRAI